MKNRYFTKQYHPSTSHPKKVSPARIKKHRIKFMQNINEEQITNILSQLQDINQKETLSNKDHNKLESIDKQFTTILIKADKTISCLYATSMQRSIV